MNFLDGIGRLQGKNAAKYANNTQTLYFWTGKTFLVNIPYLNFSRSAIVLGEVRVIGATLWSFVPENVAKSVEKTWNDYSNIYIVTDEGKRLITHTDTNIWHKGTFSSSLCLSLLTRPGDVAFIEQELKLAKENNQKAVVFSHHSPVS
jgi:hypothetical protein